MAKSPANPATAFAEAGKFTELRKRLVFLVLALVVYRIGTFIPVPGLDPAAVAHFFDRNQARFWTMFNMFAGGALERVSIFALGVMPYISASIIMQMLSVVVPSLADAQEGESGRRRSPSTHVTAQSGWRLFNPSRCR